MGNSEETKEVIIRETISLIQGMGGDVEKITIRKIADKSNVGIGLINHYFKSKDDLLEICVQKIITGVITSFKPRVDVGNTQKSIICFVACQVMDFLMDNQEISRMSILADLKKPKENDNTMGTVRGFAARMSCGNSSGLNHENAFILTAILQESFLRKDVLKQTIGIDFYNKTERDMYIERIINRFLIKEDEV